MIGALGGLGLTALSFVASWLIVYGFAVRQEGGRIFTRRRWQNFRTASVECHAGPFDGVRLPVSRRSVAFLGTFLEWPDVLYDATTGRYRFEQQDAAHRDFVRSAWVGYYKLTVLSERYEWIALDYAKVYADKIVAEVQS